MWPASSALLGVGLAHGGRLERGVVESIASGGEHCLLCADICSSGLKVGLGEFGCVWGGMSAIDDELGGCETYSGAGRRLADESI